MAQSFSVKRWAGAGGTGFVSEGAYVIEVEGIEELDAKLERLRSQHPNMEKDLKKIMRAVIAQARKKLMQEGKGSVGSGYANSAGDSRQAYRAIKSMVYKRIFGGNVSILNRRKRSGYVAQVPDSPRQTGRGGNRRQRSDKTTRMMSYWGEDRGFILRFLNNGTGTRRIKTGANASVNRMVGRGRTSASLEGVRNGNRGRIAGSHWFGRASMNAMYDASNTLTDLIDRAIQEVWGDDAISESTWKGGNAAKYGY